MRKVLFLIFILFSLNSLAVVHNATIEVNPQNESSWRINKLLFGSFLEEHWGDMAPGIYEQYIANPSFEKWSWNVKHLKTRIVFFEVPESEDVAYPWEKVYSGSGISYNLSKENPKNSKTSQHIVVTAGKKAGIKQQLALPDYRTLTYRYKFFIRKEGNVKVKVEIVDNIPLNPPSKGDFNIPLNPPRHSPGQKSSKVELYVSGITNFWKAVEGEITLEKKLVNKHKNRYGVGQFVISVEGEGEVWLDQSTLFPDDCVEGVFNPETIAYIKKYNVTMARWPGGNFTSGYHWRDGIGPVDERPTRFNPAWGGQADNQFGLDEFLRFCELTGITPVMGVGFNLPEIDKYEIADWVEYCNGGTNTPMGKLRAQNGHPEPYNVIYWGVGNEVYGHYQLGFTNAATYSKKLIKIISEMKMRDPEIKIIASGFGLHNKYRDPDNDWNKTVLKIVGNKIDMMDMHTYVHGPNDEKIISEKISKADLQKAFLSSNKSFEKFCDYFRKLIKRRTTTKKMKMAMLEWGILPANWEDSPRRTTFANALISASFYNSMIRNSDLIQMAAVHNFSYYVSPVGAHSEPVNPRTYIAKIYSGMAGGQVIQVDVKSKKYSVRNAYIDIGALSGVKDIDSVGTISDKGEIKLAILNRSQKKDYNINMRIPINKMNSTARLELLTSDNPYYRYEWSNGAKPFKKTVTKIRSTNNYFNIIVPKMSFAYITVP